MQLSILIAAIGSALIAAGESMHASAEIAQDSDDSSEGTESGAVDATTVTSTTLDADGLPWHPGIHAGTKKTKGDGTWTRKKGVADAYYAEVVAELRKTHPAPAAGGAPALTLPGATPTLALPGATPSLPTLTLPGVAPVAMSNYAKLVNFISKNVDQPGRRLTLDYINGTFKANNVEPASLATNEAGAELWLTQFRNVLTQIGETEVV